MGHVHILASSHPRLPVRRTLAELGTSEPIDKAIAVCAPPWCTDAEERQGIRPELAWVAIRT
jgi:hypothetical protein